MSAAAENIVDGLAETAERSAGGPLVGLPDATPGGGVSAWPALLICLAAALAGMAPTFSYLAPAWWQSETYSHGLLVAPLSVWLVWRQRHTIANAPVAPSAAALAMLAGMVFLWMLAFTASVQIGVESLLPLTAGLGVAATLGWRAASRVAFPIGFLYFAVSVWDVINATLQSVTTLVVGLILRLVGVPAFIEGNTVQIPSGWFEIAGGCSGLHFFIVAAALASLYGHLYYRRWTNRLGLVGLALALALVANWARVAIIITAGHLTDMQHYLVQVDHYLFGWVVFAVVLVPFFVLARRLERDQDTDRAGTDAPRRLKNPYRFVATSRLVVVSGLLLLPALVWGRAATMTDTPVRAVLPEIAGWAGPGAASEHWYPKFGAPADEERISYRRGGRVFDVYLNWYLQQLPGHELIGYGNRLEGDTGWEIESRSKREARTGQDRVGVLQETVLTRNGQQRRLVWSWYLVGPRSLTSPAKVKLLEAWRNLTGRYGAGIVALSLDCAGNCDAARPALAEAVRDLGAPLSGAYAEPHR